MKELRLSKGIHKPRHLALPASGSLGLPAQAWHVGVWLLCLLAWGCSRPTPIGDVVADPRTFDGKTVTVRGAVTGSANLAVFRGFTVRDETGEITVVTERAVPRRGETVMVRGRVKQALAVDQSSLVVLIERSQP